MHIVELNRLKILTEKLAQTGTLQRNRKILATKARNKSKHISLKQT